MDISQSTFAMCKNLMANMNDAVNELMKRSGYMNNHIQELNVLRVFASTHDLNFAVGDLLSHKNLSVYIAANMEAFGSIEQEMAAALSEATDWYMETIFGECNVDLCRALIAEGLIAESLPALFDEYILQKSFIAMSPVGQGQQSQINIFMFAK